MQDLHTTEAITILAIPTRFFSPLYLYYRLEIYQTTKEILNPKLRVRAGTRQHQSQHACSCDTTVLSAFSPPNPHRNRPEISLFLPPPKPISSSLPTGRARPGKPPLSPPAPSGLSSLPPSSRLPSGTGGRGDSAWAPPPPEPLSFPPPPPRHVPHPEPTFHRATTAPGEGGGNPGRGRADGAAAPWPRSVPRSSHSGGNPDAARGWGACALRDPPSSLSGGRRHGGAFGPLGKGGEEAAAMAAAGPAWGNRAGEEGAILSWAGSPRYVSGERGEASKGVELRSDKGLIKNKRRRCAGPGMNSPLRGCLSSERQTAPVAQQTSIKNKQKGFETWPDAKGETKPKAVTVPH